MPRLRLAHKTFLALFGTCLLVVLLAAVLARVGFDAGFRNYLEHREDARLTALAQELAAVWAQQDSWAPVQANRRLFGHLLFGTDHHGERRAAVRAGPGPTDHVPPGGPRSGAWRQVPATSLLDAERRLIAGPPPPQAAREVPVTHQGITVGWVVTRAAGPMTQRAEAAFRRSQGLWLASALLAALLLAAVLAVPLSRRLTRPILAVADGARALAAGGEQTRVAVTGRDELAQLAQDFNHLAASLARANQARRDWMADISHELRTPLAVALAELQALQDGVRPLDAAALASLREELDRLHHLIEDLFTLARNDLGAMDYRMAPLDLGQLVGQAVGQWQPRFADAGLTLTGPDSPPALPIQGDEDRLVQVLTNLLYNSLRYTDKGGEVRLDLALEQGNALLTVADSAPGVSADDLPRLFERFFRGDASRRRSTGGSGLGLALVQTICSAHGGTVAAEASPLGGLRVVLRLPLAAST